MQSTLYEAEPTLAMAIAQRAAPSRRGEGRDADHFGMVDGVWVSDPLSAIPLAAALLQQLVALDRERQ